jgi:hypothetical protein
MVSKWIEPEPLPKQVDDTPSTYNPDAPTFDLMKRQIGKNSSTTKRKVFTTKIHHHKPL